MPSPRHQVTEMVRIRPVEVSLVGQPAIKREFLTLKNQEGAITMTNILEVIKNVEAENEDSLVETLKEQGMSDDAVEAAKVVSRAISGMRDEFDAEAFLEIGKATGFEFEVVDGDEDADAGDDTTGLEDIDKSQLDDSLVELIEGLSEKAEKAVELEKQIERDGYVEKADNELYNLTASSADLGKVLHTASKSMDEDSYETLKRVLKSANERLEESGEDTSSTEKGTNLPGSSGDALEEFIAKRDELMEEDDISKGQATLRVGRENPDLYSRYNEQKNS